MNCRGSIEACKYEISLVFDMIEHRRDSVCQGKVEGPIGRGGETDGFCSNIGRKDFRGISPKFVSDKGERGSNHDTGPQEIAKLHTKR